MLKGYMAGTSLGILDLNLNHGDRLQMKVPVALVDSQHGSVTCVETSETERWYNGKMERTTAKSSLLDFETLQKTKIFGEQPERRHR